MNCSRMNQVCWLSLHLCLVFGHTGMTIQEAEQAEAERSVASPADIRTRGYLIWICCPHVTFMSQDKWVCPSFTDGNIRNLLPTQSPIGPSNFVKVSVFLASFLTLYLKYTENKKKKKIRGEDLKGTLHRERLRHFWHTLSRRAFPFGGVK